MQEVKAGHCLEQRLPAAGLHVSESVFAGSAGGCMGLRCPAEPLVLPPLNASSGEWTVANFCRTLLSSKRDVEVTEDISKLPHGQACQVLRRRTMA